MRKAILVAVLGAGLLFGLGGGVALAAKPANEACLGEDISGYAAGGSDFGQFISAIARNGTSGAGYELQLHLAGSPFP